MISFGRAPIKDEIEAAVKNVFNKANFILGEEVTKFEKEFAAHNGTKYAVGVANGTDAIRMALIASGVKKGDEVITSPFTFTFTLTFSLQDNEMEICLKQGRRPSLSNTVVPCPMPEVDTSLD